jgi:hypothetical protein
MFCVVDTGPLREVQGVVALISAAEMLGSILPEISSPFVACAVTLIQTFAWQAAATHFEEVNSVLSSAAGAPAASPDELERFGDQLQSAATADRGIELHRLAYLAYAAASARGPLPPRVAAKLAEIKPFITVKAALNSPDIDSLPSLSAPGPSSPR